MGAKSSKDGSATPKLNFKNRKNKKDSSRPDGEEDNSVDVSGHAILSNPLILEAIFSHLQILHLLQASSVCRLWNSEVRKYLQKRRRCLIKLDLDRLINTDAERFKKFLQSSWTLPFQGLWISLSSAEVEYDNDFPIWEVFPSILEKLEGNFKSLGLRIHSSCSNPAGNNSRAEKCIQEILRLTMHKLEFLRLDGDPSRIIRDYNAVGFKETDMLDKMQEFDFSASGRWDDLAWGFCKQVASASPNLRRLNGYVTPDWLRLPTFPSIHERGLVKKFKFLTNSPEDSEIAKDFVTSHNDIKYKKLIVSGLWRHASQTSRYVCRQLLLSSEEILEQLSMHNKDLILFATAGAFPENGFPRLRRFKIKTRWEKSIDKFLSDGIDFNAHFPHLKYVEIKWRVSHALKSKKKQQKEDDEKAAEEDCDNSIIIPCKTVKILTVDFGYSYQYPQLLPKLAKYFPQVEHLYVHDGTQELRQYVAELGTIWTTTLKTMSFTQVRDAQIKSLTGVFCGVSDAEIEGMESQQNGSKGLALQSPSQRSPCILDNLGLRILRFEIVHVGTQWKKLEKLRQKQPGMVMLGKVAGVLALSKLPGLTIELYLKGRHELVDPKHRFSLDHLKEYVTVKKFDRGFNMDDIVY